jgi:hypothetical protein
MTRTFKHLFEPEHLTPSPGGATKLTVREIESAGINEVLQTAGVRVGSWAILDALLDPNDDSFIFKEPLGQAREVKVAVSGLFGRFVARAYLQRYVGLSFFGHLGSTSVLLAGRSLAVRRRRNARGDLPDWVACNAQLGELTVAEAKGCHDKDPSKRLAKAYQQAQRVDVIADGKPMDVKRIAIVTRWASKMGGHKIPIITVKDPLETGDSTTAARLDEAGVGIARLHVANLLEPLGLRELAASIRAMLRGPEIAARATFGSNVQHAEQVLSAIRPRRLVGPAAALQAGSSEMIGSFVTRAGPLDTQELSQPAARELRVLNLKPVFVGIERRMLEAVINGDPARLRQETQRDRSTESVDVNADSAGTWLINVRQGLTVE